MHEMGVGYFSFTIMKGLRFMVREYPLDRYIAENLQESIKVTDKISNFMPLDMIELVISGF